ncbi:sulfatase-like hydrolase/transferase [Nocardioides litoris]|uniref:sulfatase-like hydrolase/transferase n=1 Tax=Nocardioides litoris TaxID=1926648 RepID=UPI00112069E6|nr:sulfatase-like hydrolase/transferase [Nocardioides litoris]
MTTSGRRRLLATLVALLLLAPTASTATAPASADVVRGAGQPGQAAQAAAAGRPNVLLITTDDMRADDLRGMPLTRRLIGAAGLSATGLAPHPLCCPARAQILTGQYAHHNGVRGNQGVHGLYQALRQPDETIARWVERAGYDTGMVGKFLNGYGSGSRRPPGWQEWHPFVTDVYQPYDVGMVEGDRVVADPFTHSNDVVRNKTISSLDALRADGDGRPFFMWSSYVAPHGTCEEKKNCSDPPIPARRHLGLDVAGGNPAERSRSFGNNRGNYFGSGVSGRANTRPYLRRLDVARQRALASVDEGIAATLSHLARIGELDDTYVIFTSDNGYLLGEHRYTGKNVPYEPALKVPFLVRGPGIAAGQRRPDLVASLVDLAPTILRMTGGVEGRSGALDGADLLPVLLRQAPVRRTAQLIDIGPSSTFKTINRPWTLRGVRTQRYTYWVWYTGRRPQLFDRRADPAMVRDVAADPRYRTVRRQLQRTLRRLVTCAGPQQCRPTIPVLGPRRR